MKTLSLSLSAIFFIFIFTTCRKTTPPGPDDFYFQCKIDGRLYIPNSCANCRLGKLLGDTTFLINGNAGYESIAMGIINVTGEHITTSRYVLNQNPRFGGDYKNSTILSDQYNTDSTHIGQLEIISLDKSKRIIQGTFFFKAYNSYRDDSVSITDGKFRLKYTID